MGDDDKGAIDGAEHTCLGAWVWVGVATISANIKEGVKAAHVAAHVAGPFEDLGADVCKECMRGPAAKDHDLGHGNISKEECHSGTGLDGLVPNLMGFKTKDSLATKEGAGSAEEFLHECVGDEEDGPRNLQDVDSG